jgi:phage-related protein
MHYSGGFEMKLTVSKSAYEYMNQLPEGERSRIIAALQKIQANPTSSEYLVVPGANEPPLRVTAAGDFRIAFRLYPSDSVLMVVSIHRQNPH